MIVDLGVNLIWNYLFRLILGLYLLECNLDFNNVLGIYYVENT